MDSLIGKHGKKYCAMQYLASLMIFQSLCLRPHSSHKCAGSTGVASPMDVAGSTGVDGATGVTGFKSADGSTGVAGATCMARSSRVARFTGLYNSECPCS